MQQHLSNQELVRSPDRVYSGSSMPTKIQMRITMAISCRMGSAAITSQQSHGSKTESSSFSTEHSSSCKAPHDRCKTQQQERRSRLNVCAACRCMGSGATVSPRKLASSLENPEWQPLHSTVDKMHEILPCKQPGTSHRSAMWPSRQAESGGGEVN